MNQTVPNQKHNQCFGLVVHVVLCPQLQIVHMSGQKEAIVLYTKYDSSPTWRVRIVLALKGVQFERKFYRFDKPDPTYKDVNPLVQIPTIVIDGDIITQSLAIIDYLDQKYPEPTLLPTDLKKRAKAKQIAEIINSGIQPQCNFYFKIYGDDVQKYYEQSKKPVEKGFVAIEKILSQTAGKFCIGDDFTLADVCLAPQVFYAERYGVDLAMYPKIKEVSERLLNVEAVRSTHPDNEPDSQALTKA